MIQKLKSAAATGKPARMLDAFDATDYADCEDNYLSVEDGDAEPSSPPESGSSSGAAHRGPVK